MPHPPLSQSLRKFIETDEAHGGRTLNHLIKQTEERGIYLIIILLNLPFLTPASIPGFSIIFGFVIFLLSIRLALDLPPKLPRFIGEHKLESKAMDKVLLGSVKLVTFLEKWIKPRRSRWMTKKTVRAGNALLIAFLALLLMLPIPPIILFTNTLPGYGIVFLAASMMEEDGLMIWVGHAIALCTVLYFILMADLIFTVSKSLIERFL